MSRLERQDMTEEDLKLYKKWEEKLKDLSLIERRSLAKALFDGFHEKKEADCIFSLVAFERRDNPEDENGAVADGLLCITQRRPGALEETFFEVGKYVDIEIGHAIHRAFGQGLAKQAEENLPKAFAGLISALEKLSAESEEE